MTGGKKGGLRGEKKVQIMKGPDLPIPHSATDTE